MRGPDRAPTFAQDRADGDFGPLAEGVQPLGGLFPKLRLCKLHLTNELPNSGHEFAVTLVSGSKELQQFGQAANCGIRSHGGQAIGMVVPCLFHKGTKTFIYLLIGEVPLDLLQPGLMRPSRPNGFSEKLPKVAIDKLAPRPAPRVLEIVPSRTFFSRLKNADQPATSRDEGSAVSRNSEGLVPSHRHNRSYQLGTG